MASVELKDKTELTVITGTENIYIQEAGSPFTVKRLLLDTIKNWILSAFDVTPIGTIIMYANASAPANYLTCNGDAVSRTTFSALFAVTGTVYGAGNGTTTFNLPNYSGLSPKGVGNQTINTRVKTGPASVGAKIEDTFESHAHAERVNAFNVNADSRYPTDYRAGNDGGGQAINHTAYTQNNILSIITPIGDGANVLRTGAQTQDCTIGTNFCIRYA